MTDERRDSDETFGEDVSAVGPPREREFETPPAPVVMDDDYEQYPLPRASLRDLERQRPRSDTPEFGARLAAVGLTLVAAAWLLAFTAQQVTSPGVALPVIQRGVDALTGLPALVVMHEEAIRTAAAQAPEPDSPVPVPGFEVQGIALTRAEVAAGGPAEWHRLLRERTALAIRQDGSISILAISGEPVDEGVFSTSGGVRRVMENLSESNHSTAGTVAWPLGLVALGFAALVLVFGGPFSRFTLAGFALFVAAVPVALAGLLAMGVVAFAGSDGSAIADDFHGMAATLARAPLTNALVLGGAGLLIAIPGWLAGAIFDRSQRVSRAVERVDAVGGRG